ncbi:MAG: S1 family peptidase [Alphaproteobacteria bacterium]|nr:S1 family peptidase [Alphaproteobacteria bacterium]
MMPFRPFASAILVALSLGVAAPDAAAMPDQDLERRARNGSVEAMVKVGEQYLQQGDQRSLIEAFAWLHLADEWGGMPQYLFGRDRDALRRLQATEGDEAVRKAQALYEERRVSVLETIGRIDRERENGPASLALVPGLDEVRRKVGRLILTYKGGNARGCTATLVDPLHVLTAAHCVEDQTSGDTAMAAYFLPGYSGSVGDQAQAAVADRAIWDPAWKDLGHSPDVAIVRLQASPQGDPITVATNGYLAFDAPSAPIVNTEVRLIGYPFAEEETPNEMPVERLVDRNCVVSDTPDGLMLQSTDLCDMAQGASGGPVLVWDAEANRVEIVGVTSFIAPRDGDAFFARMTPEVRDRVAGWIANDPPVTTGGIVARNLIPRPIYWMSVRNECGNAVRAGAIGRPYDSNTSRTYVREIPAHSTGIIAGPLSEADPVVNVTDMSTGRILFGEGGQRFSIGGVTVPADTVSGGGYGRIGLTVRCAETG